MFVRQFSTIGGKRANYWAIAICFISHRSRQKPVQRISFIIFCAANE